MISFKRSEIHLLQHIFSKSFEGENGAFQSLSVVHIVGFSAAILLTETQS